jgi:hypothetical protein
VGTFAHNSSPLAGWDDAQANIVIEPKFVAGTCRFKLLQCLKPVINITSVKTN